MTKRQCGKDASYLPVNKITQRGHRFVCTVEMTIAEWRCPGPYIYGVGDFQGLFSTRSKIYMATRRIKITSFSRYSLFLC